MRLVWLILASLAVAQCATPEDRRFRAGDSPTSYVIMGVAEAAANTSPDYRVLWRRLDNNGQFMRYGARRIFEARTGENETRRINGIPGEFILSEIEPGTYALDSVFAVMRDGRVNYIANGVILGSERPGFTVRPGEAIYLGIWQADLDELVAVTSLWRLDEADL